MEIQDKKAPVLAIIGADKAILSATLLKYKEFYKDQPEDQQIVLLVDRTDVENGIKPNEFGWATVKELSEALEDGRLLDFQKRVENGPVKHTFTNPLHDLKDEQVKIGRPLSSYGGMHHNKKKRDFKKDINKKKQQKKARKKNR